MQAPPPRQIPEYAPDYLEVRKRRDFKSPISNAVGTTKL